MTPVVTLRLVPRSRDIHTQLSDDSMAKMRPDVQLEVVALATLG